jgi:hypothetical protein
MNERLRAYLDEQARAMDADVREALEACGGDPMHALRVAIIANTFLMEENEKLKAQISAGFSRGQVRKPAVAKK